MSDFYVQIFIDFRYQLSRVYVCFHGAVHSYQYNPLRQATLHEACKSIEQTPNIMAVEQPLSTIQAESLFRCFQPFCPPTSVILQEYQRHGIYNAASQVGPKHTVQDTSANSLLTTPATNRTVAAPEKILRGANFLIMIKATHSVGTLSKTVVSICCQLINSYSNTFLSIDGSTQQKDLPSSYIRVASYRWKAMEKSCIQEPS